MSEYIGDAPQLLPDGNWHAIEGANGKCGCGPTEGCGERLRRYVWSLLDNYDARTKYLERERERTMDELPDAFRRYPGSLSSKVRRMLEVLHAHGTDERVTFLRTQVTDLVNAVDVKCRRIAELERAINDAIDYANRRETEWGDRAIQCFEILRAALDAANAKEEE